MAGRGAWRQSHHRRLPRFCSDAVPHRLAMRQRFLLLPCPSGRRWRRRRHRTCVHRRARWRAPPWGTQRRTRPRRMTTVSSTSGGFHRRRRRHRRFLRGRQDLRPHAEGCRCLDARCCRLGSLADESEERPSWRDGYGYGRCGSSSSGSDGAVPLGAQATAAAPTAAEAAARPMDLDEDDELAIGVLQRLNTAPVTTAAAVAAPGDGGHGRGRGRGRGQDRARLQ